MSRKWSLKSRSLTFKTLLALGVLAIGSGALIGAIVGYAENSDEKLGPLSKANKDLFDNDYSKIYDANNNLTPKLAILNGTKATETAKISDDATEFYFLDDPDTKYDFDTFFNKYFEKYAEAFVLEIKYGSFSFFDEYVLAVRPKQFLEFSNWFITNVAWGPDLLTLDSFRLVPGVEQNGNAITLGSHSTLHKEVSEIKFFPDAFFGSLPIFSSLGGRGNATDSLTYSTFNGEVTKPIIDEYLNQLETATSLKNKEAVETYEEIVRPEALINKRFKVDLGDKNFYDRLFLADDITDAQFEAIKAKYPNDFDNVDYKNLKTYEVTKVKINEKNTYRGAELDVYFKEPDKSATDSKNTLIATYDLTKLTTRKFVSYKTLLEATKNTIRSFLDFYDIDDYKNREFYWYEDDNKQNHFYKLFVEAINNNKELKLKKYEEQKQLVKKYKINDFIVTANNDEQQYTLEVKLTDPSDSSKTTSLSFVANKANDYSPEGFDEFTQAIGYAGAINPITLFYTQEDNSLKDLDGNVLKGLDSRNYQIYSEVYSGLIKKVTKKYPHLLRSLNGPHIERSVNEKGVFKYELKDGAYKGFSPNDRIGLPIILAALVPGFDGLPTDFLKYVATHEYGHHYTLDQGQAWIDNNNPVVVGGLSTRGGASDASFYSYQALINYLEARTNLEIVRVNANNQPTPTGKFIRFRFGILDENNKVIKYETEKIEDIWGTNRSSDALANVLKNKKRRFLQDFAGIVEAAKQRKVALGDIFFANSFDADSGTLNPSISGIAKVFAKVQSQMKNPEYKWVEVTPKSIISQLSDGAGNPLLDKSVFVDAAGNLSFKIYETDPNDKKKITKINMFNKDGSPVIQVPLNVSLSDEELAYVTQKANVIADSIKATIRENLADNGWNKTSSVLPGEVSVSLNNIARAIDFNDLVKKIKSRNNPNELDPNENAWNSTKRTGFSYLSLKPNLTGEMSSLYQFYYEFIKFKFEGNRDASTDILNKSDVNKILAFLKSDNDHKFENTTRYVFPYVNDNVFLGSIMNVKDGRWDAIRSFAAHNNLGFYRGPFTQNFTIGFFSATATEENNLLKPIFAYGLEERINEKDTAKIVTIAEIDDLINNKHKTTEELDNSVRVFINPFSTSLKASDAVLLSVVKKDKRGRVNNSQTGKNRQTYKAKNIAELLEFGSIDYSKATYDQKTSTYNWDVEYVKSKFDFEGVENLLSQNLDKLKRTEKLREAITSAGSDKSKKDQAIANYTMSLFRHSNLFISVKDFSPATDLVKNRAIFSKDYGITMVDENFSNFYREDLSKIDNKDNAYFDINSLQHLINRFVTTFKLEDYKDKISLHDLLLLTGNIAYYTANGRTLITYGSVEFGKFSPGIASDDVINYNDTRVEPLLNDKFTDYVYNIAETLTRDYVQITYAPNTQQFSNSPEYLNGISEAITGLDYIVDGTIISNLNNLKIDQAKMANAINRILLGSHFTKMNEEIVVLMQKYDQDIKDLEEKENQVRKRLDEAIKRNKNDKFSEEVEKIQKEVNDIVDARGALLTKRAVYNNKALGKYFDEITRKNFLMTNELRTSSYFGKFISNNNGYFKDRWEKQKIGIELYDDQRNPIIDENIRTKDFKGNKINSRPEAFFISQLYNYGVSRRNVSGLFRNKNLDALAMYGYIDTELAKNVKYLRFTDIHNGETKYLKVNIARTNNLFWLQKQGDASSKKSIEDYGYTSWLTDYAIMGKYRDALLKPQHTYTIDFVDENHQFLASLDLGDLKSISENAKAAEQSPVKIENKNETTPDGEKTKKTIITIDYQFNVNN
ncbi:PDxFFG protein [Mycoplasma sp. E35C]|uniref:PDxFFG protein n=1 Tax=Mycoplasma sp. E35C TaxID=2801918 RepID=UPI001CA4234F|nr:PDxFFG protein [Mycoplasma sp. E35C]QZX48955.1 PDxFFG protein [Mycoplasma sp. E35C]